MKKETAQITVRKLLHYLQQSKYEELFDDECNRRLENVAESYGNVVTEEGIMEISLLQNTKECDYSIKVLKDDPICKEYWYELDFDACKEKEIRPCFFVDASIAKPLADYSILAENILPHLFEKEFLEKIHPMLDRCIQTLSGKCSSLYQIGAMSGRGQKESMRIFPFGMKKEDVLSYLDELNWKGDLLMLGAFLTEMEPYAMGGLFIVDFDITCDGISDKIGINFGTGTGDYRSCNQFLTFLVKKGYCTEEKKKGVQSYLKTYPQYEPYIANDISHFKFAISGGKILKSKAYLRHGTVCYRNDYEAFSMPVIMNLELTDRCPLHCKQCYCDLNHGKDLDLEMAMHWLKEAAQNHVKYINLSGGETMLYHHLEELIAFCTANHMESNIAISGAGFHESRARNLIDAGVSAIFVSLNGSTKEMNEKTRDGYELALDALSLLKKLSFPDVHINWVMHNVNADDFTEILKLAEQYAVKEIDVMMFKPDSSHERKSLPSKEQMLRLKQVIKEYQGPVKIVVENCFSQMKALMGQRFFTNLNRGILRGCGAGVDGISINVDGKITPCRHLELPEDDTSIRTYWENSLVLKQLRNRSKHALEPCSNCSYQNYCLPCPAVNEKLIGKLDMGGVECTLS